MLIDRIIIGNMFTNAYVVSTGKKDCVLIDPGSSSKTILQRLESMNLIPQAIILTHGLFIGFYTDTPVPYCKYTTKFRRECYKNVSWS